MDLEQAPLSRRSARFVLLGCALALLAGLGGIGGLAMSRPSSSVEDGRIVSAAAGISFVPPPGWTQRTPDKEKSGLVYGQVALQKGDDNQIILIGKMDGALFAADEPDDAKAAGELAAGMGEFFFPDSGRRTDREQKHLAGAETTGASAFYRVQFDNAGQPKAEVYAAVLRAGDSRWWVTWLSDSRNPIDKDAAQRLAESIDPL
ncbi:MULTISPECIES: alanine and proline-rich secreted protein Apa [unclassified Nocardia]|uniref:alanine and proline-rich secreted protein Apa n=1 Tax=unclassified Nocardia TaxID=2637762 RepID=UPI001CE46878|nr:MULTISPECIES: alanine and proline-rich secreted protein Apa [unclassified Nocardia]